MDLSIVIVSWNVCDRLRECLRSIREHAADPAFRYEVFVVDNASADGSAVMVAEEFPWVHVITNHENVGFAKANNQAMRRSQGEYILLLNPDMRVLPGTLSGIVAFLRASRNRRVGIAGCHLVDERGQTVEHVRQFPRLLDQLAVLTKAARVWPRLMQRYLCRGFDYGREARVDSIRGSFFCIRRELLDHVGVLDEDYFIWFEEVDFCMRARRAGWEVAYTPSVRCIDDVGQSFKQVRFFSKQRMFSRSMLTYFRKHRPRWEWAVLALVRPFVLAAAWIADRLRP